MGIHSMMLLRSSSNLSLNSLTGIHPESELNSHRSFQLAQFHVAGNGHGKWVHHDVRPRLGRTRSEADLHNPLSNGSLNMLWFRRGSGSADVSRKISAEDFLSKDLLEEALEEEFEDSEAEISIGFQSARDSYEQSREKISAAIQTQGPEGPYVVQDLMGGQISEGTGLGLVWDRVDLGTKTESDSVNGGFGVGNGGGFSGGGGYG